MSFILENKINEDTCPSNARIEIIEQPAPKALRFRYECEGRLAGSIPGENTTFDNRTYPTIRVVGYEGNEDIVIVVCCVTKNPPYLVHPHNLVGQDCKDGVCSINLDKDSKTAVFSNLGIQCVRKRDIEKTLTLRESKCIDPFKNGFQHKNNPNSIDLNCVRLCFHAITKPGLCTVARVVSNPIYDKKAISDLLITKLSHSSGPAGGGTEMILLCNKINKDDIQVRFFDETEGRKWEGLARKLFVHHQFAICFKTPPYHKQELRDKVQVYVQLYRPSDKAISEPREFHYTASASTSSSYQNQNHDRTHPIPIPIPGPSSRPVPWGRSWTTNLQSPSCLIPNLYLPLTLEKTVQTEQALVDPTFGTDTLSSQDSINTSLVLAIERRLFPTNTNASSEATEPLASYGNTTNPITNEENPINVEMTSLHRIIDTNDLVDTSANNANNAGAGPGNEELERLCDDVVRIVADICMRYYGFSNSTNMST